jgi:hypothetical protein
MSATLTWRPIQPEGGTLPKALRFILEKRYEFPREFGAEDEAYLRGLGDAGVEGARDLLNLIGEYGRVQLRLEY